MNRADIERLAPASGRRSSLVAALEVVWDRTDGGPARIVEVGTSRNTSERAAQTDGWATRVFAWYAHNVGGRLTSIDVKPRAIVNARSIVGKYGAPVRFVLGDALRLLPPILASHPAVLLYVDGAVDAAWNLALWNAILPQDRPPLVLLDDVIGDGPWTGPCASPSWYAAAERPWGPRGTLLVPELRKQGYDLCCIRDHQILLSRPADNDDKGAT